MLVSLMYMDTKFSTKYYKAKVNNTFKGLYTMIEYDSSLG